MKEKFIVGMFIILLTFSCKESIKEKLTNKKNQKMSIEEKPKNSNIHTELSRIFDFQSTIKRVTMNGSDSCMVKIIVNKKSSHKTVFIATINSESSFFDSTYLNKNVHSYITGVNRNENVGDNDYGDIIVADFNFDNREDFAAKREEGSACGPMYNFYIQTPDCSFKLDKFLSDSLIWFPAKFNVREKTLTTLIIAGNNGVLRTTYKYESKKNKWIKISQKYIGD